MSAQGLITFRIFSGPHLGAELVLPAGTHSVGSDDSCDIILHDSSLAARHIQLVVSGADAAEDTEAPTSTDQNPAALEVRLFSLDGPALVNGEALPEGASLAPYSPCFLGLTCFAWGGLGQQDTGWRTVAEALHETSPKSSHNAAQPNTTQKTLEKLDNEEDSAISAPQTPAKTTPPTMEGTDANNIDSLSLAAVPQKLPANDKSKRLLIVFLVLLTLCGLTVTYEKSSPSDSKRIEIIRKKLKEAGFKHLTIEQKKPGLTISGPLQNDTERGALLKLAQSMQYPLHLDIEVGTDRVNAISTAFNSRKIFPLVWEQPFDKGKRLHIAGYMKDGLVEEWAFSSLMEDVPELAAEKPENIVRKIRHADAVEAVLGPALKKAQLNFAQVSYLPGTIEISGAFNVGQRKQLDAALDHTRMILGVPLNISVRSPTPELPRQQTASAPSGVPAKRNEAGPSGLNINGVTMSPMRYVSLGTGEKVFEGGMLPGGYILESIGIHELKLSKDGRLTVYQLRGSNE